MRRQGDAANRNSGTMTELERQKAGSVLEEVIPEDVWEVYAPVLVEARRAGVRFAIGGGVAFSLYAVERRYTKDLDVFVVPPDQDELLRILAKHGYTEFTEFPYDRTCSYRSIKKECIFDVLWSMLNAPIPMDEHWVERGWDVHCRGIDVRIIPPEELIWAKLYILYRERCDWPDVLAVMHAKAERIDWRWLLQRLGGDNELLGSELAMFRWLCPGRASRLPDWLWKEVGLAPMKLPATPEVDAGRAERIRGTGWFPSEGVPNRK